MPNGRVIIARPKVIPVQAMLFIQLFAAVFPVVVGIAIIVAQPRQPDKWWLTPSEPFGMYWLINHKWIYGLWSWRPFRDGLYCGRWYLFIQMNLRAKGTSSMPGRFSMQPVLKPSRSDGIQIAHIFKYREKGPHNFATFKNKQAGKSYDNH